MERGEAAHGAGAPVSRRPRHLRLALLRALMAIVPAYSLNRTRLLALRACGLRVGRATLFWGMPEFRGDSQLLSRLKVGTHCGFNEGCLFDLAAPIEIGDHVSVGHEVRFLTRRTDGQGAAADPIRIGDGVWLAARSTVLAGVTVGNGAVIGAGTTVAVDVPPNTLVMGDKQIALPSW